MDINSILKDKSLTKYQLSKMSGVPYSTIRDLCTNRTNVEKCTAETVYKISIALQITMEQLLKDYISNTDFSHRVSFELFKSNVCHDVKRNGDERFIEQTIKSDIIRRYYQNEWFPESLYLLAMIDYLCRINNIKLCDNYNDLRTAKLNEIIYPASIIALAEITKDENYKCEAFNNSIPEFKRFNIIENEVQNVI